MSDAKNYVGGVLHGCARCGGEHEDVVYMPLERPARLGDEVVITHWSPCPTNSEPILMLVEAIERHDERGHGVSKRPST